MLIESLSPPPVADRGSYTGPPRSGPLRCACDSISHLMFPHVWGCCRELIMSPRERNRNVPLSWWPPGRSPIGKDGDECERIDAGGGVESRKGGDIEFGFGGDAVGGELSPGEAFGAAVSGGRGERTEAPGRGWRVESCAAHGRAGAGVGARAGKGQRADRRAVWAHAGRRAFGQ